MIEKEKKLIIEKIQNSKLDLSLIFSGCGFQFFNNILKVSGSSKFFINAEFPYSKKVLENKYQLKNPFVSKLNAETLCTKSINEFNSLKNKQILMSIGCVGSIKTFYNKKGTESAWVYLKSSQNQNYFYKLKFNKNHDHTRESQDELINISILLVLNNYIDSNYDFINLYKNSKSIFSQFGSSLIEEESNFNE
mgnify:FL=1|tara:strand:- start:976 stop:1554 length:579 start_codon:yes stop_codon:yes gene_type:complete